MSAETEKWFADPSTGKVVKYDDGAVPPKGHIEVPAPEHGWDLWDVEKQRYEKSVVGRAEIVTLEIRQLVESLPLDITLAMPSIALLKFRLDGGDLPAVRDGIPLVPNPFSPSDPRYSRVESVKQLLIAKINAVLQ